MSNNIDTVRPGMHVIPCSLEFARLLDKLRRDVGIAVHTGALPPYELFVDRLFKQLHLIAVPMVLELVSKAIDTGDGALDLDTLKASLDTMSNRPEWSALHAGVGCAGEGGELLDVVKKVALYNHQWTDLHKEDQRSLTEHLLEEMADFRFYYQKLLNMLGITDADVRVYSYHKLSQRYASGTYSDAQAQARADKPEATRKYMGQERRK